MHVMPASSSRTSLRISEPYDILGPVTQNAGTGLPGSMSTHTPDLVCSKSFEEGCYWQTCLLFCSVNTVEQLGHGSVTKLKGLHQSYDQTSSSAVGSLAALTCTQRTTSHQASSISTERALQLLQGAPYLTDLEEWMQWSVTAQGSLGPLHAFLQAQGTPVKLIFDVLHAEQCCILRSMCNCGQAVGLAVRLVESQVGCSPMVSAA